MSYTINKLSVIKVRSVTRPGMNGDGPGYGCRCRKAARKAGSSATTFAAGAAKWGSVPITPSTWRWREKAKACRLVLLEKRDPIEERDKPRAEYMQQ
jgi:hypothetical protein